MKLLAFETATEACAVAVYDDGRVLERFEIAPRRHAELALPWAQALLDEAGIRKSQLDAIAISKGPGAFTGVRLAIAIGQGIALALDRPMLAVSTLAALAWPSKQGPVLAAIDARMGEIYTGAFDWRDGQLQAISAEQVLLPGAVELPVPADGWHGVGSGFAAVDGVLRQRCQAGFASIDETALPRAAAVAGLAALAFARGEILAPEKVEPAYLRNNVALTLAEQQALRASKAASRALE
ncbi:tRNA (adenosine(37)-N6)-threonylcarbamoyltransferase complex dimerization subunit type 1 TsaB [Pseudoxanthomonas dokdonensis]|uniref:tRNA threonylcarbamoyladenosine biosynthesis protein TsaB n=1 Tax=Pseudoxanthomonas dokdonensis TaxID=344882 RepID=A0A0R0CN67_9GAMM|nr:tRNA (adenosine(37)-N6)-threonylcarbamoyltransferase complex dimerization subunit type 1 TsaB [Pseudoxanthomonas dokdonensis]KRG71468.1 glycoprotease [Pseudoxanthomonas dokdonensis]